MSSDEIIVGAIVTIIITLIWLGKERLKKKKFNNITSFTTDKCFVAINLRKENRVDLLHLNFRNARSESEKIIDIDFLIKENIGSTKISLCSFSDSIHLPHVVESRSDMAVLIGLDDFIYTIQRNDNKFPTFRLQIKSDNGKKYSSPNLKITKKNSIEIAG